MMKSLVYSLAFCLLLCSCGWGIGDDVEAEASDSLDVDTIAMEELDLFDDAPIPDAADKLFDDFFYSYVTDESYRTERTTSGLSFNAFDDMPEAVFSIVYEREEDLELAKDTSVNEVSVEMIDWSDDRIVRYRFNRNNEGKWYLTGTEDDHIDNTPNAGFFAFMHDVVTDSLYQHESIEFPLQYTLYSYEDAETIHTSFEPDEWNALCDELPDLSEKIVSVDYGQTIISQNRKSVQLKGLVNSMAIKFHFVFSSGRWRLVQMES